MIQLVVDSFRSSSPKIVYSLISEAVVNSVSVSFIEGFLNVTK